MTTGYEAQYYRDMAQGVKALQAIESILEKIAITLSGIETELIAANNITIDENKEKTGDV